MNLYQERSKNIWKTLWLMTGFLVVVIAIGYGVSWYFNSPVILYGAIVFAFGMNFYSYWFSDRQVLSMTNARAATREEFFDLYTVVENLSITAGIQTPKIYVIEDPAPNAFATGRNEAHAVVCATTGLLSMMTRSELEGVIGHELSHIRNRDMLVMTVAVVLAGFVAMLAQMFTHMSFFGGGSREEGRSNPLFLILSVVGIILAPIGAQLIQLAISRRREFLADASGALLTRYPQGLASALEKIGNYAQPMQSASPATAHLFIGNPFGAEASSFMNRLFSTHPPVSDRVKALLGSKMIDTNP
jgi:heat shock protein HtpX